MANKSKINASVRAKLEELGVDTIRSKLAYIIGVRTLGQMDDKEELGGGVRASGREMQDWLREKAAYESRWTRVGVITAVIAAIAAVPAAVFAYLALGK
jgi:hypothetical protein